MQAEIRNNKIIIEFETGRVSPEVLSLLSSLETSKKSAAKKSDIAAFAREIKQGWWKKNKKRFIDECCH
jgi:hypothetical protein